MKVSSKIVTVALFLFVAISVHAETTYVQVKADPDVWYSGNYSKHGDTGAKLLTKWEKSNPDKKIVSVTTHSGGGRLFYGFWITWEWRSK